MSDCRDQLYGWRHADLTRAAQQVSRALGVSLELRISTLRGGDYYIWRGERGAEIIVQLNFRDEYGEFEVPRFPAYPVLLYASGLSQLAYEVLGQLDAVELLESRTPPAHVADSVQRAT
jgi:hypothetical protein